MLDIWFQHHGNLLLLLPVAALSLALLVASWRAHRRVRLAYSEEALLARHSLPQHGQIVPLILLLVGMTSLVVAYADPVTSAVPSVAAEGSLQVIAVIDVSNSMGAEPYRDAMPPVNGVPGSRVQGPYGNSLDMTKHIVTGDIMPAIVGNQLGVVLYAGAGYAQAELTNDFGALRWVLTHWIEVGDAYGGGSNYADGLSQAVAMFARRDSQKQRTIVLFSDGGFTGDPQMLGEVLAEMRRLEIRLVIVAVGPSRPMPIPMYDSADRFVANFPGSGEILTTSVDEANLRALALQYGAEYIRVTPNSSIPIAWASVISGGSEERNLEHLYQFPLCLAMLSIALLFLRGITRHHK